MKPQLIERAQDFRRRCDTVRASSRAVGLVLTMGALHRGHMALVQAAKARGLVPLVTIFVNPTQFGPNEDYARYPRTLERDLELCGEHGVESVFCPSVEEMYPPGDRTRVRVSGLTQALCGPKRPGHFEGVATVVTKFFALAGPCVAFFGRKDYQQLQVIRRFARDLLLPVEVKGEPTVREPDGLALSSRNSYLSADERACALVIPRALSAAVARHRAGERRAEPLRTSVQAALEAAGMRVDYVELATPEELEPISDASVVGERALLALAAFVGKTRLIDNVVL
ncbi:MAG TPA: pantoate--beta-alanine ligase, partial [Polyangiaceae bacterium]|nr:pantoate--beta-alanine ligase [Polyangiaceae bacterium]